MSAHSRPPASPLLWGEEGLLAQPRLGLHDLFSEEESLGHLSRRWGPGALWLWAPGPGGSEETGASF